MRQIIGLLILCFVVGVLGSCVSKKKFDELQAAKDASDRSLAETQQQLKTLQDDNNTLKTNMEAEKTRMNNEMSSIRRDLDASKSQVAQVQERLNMTQQELDNIKKQVNDMFSAYQASGLRMEERDGRLYIVTAQPVTYTSGSARLSRRERQALGELATTLKNNSNLRILVEGHTDSQKYPRGAGYDNWNLSVDRALNVARELMRRGVSANQVAVVGRGEANPVGDNGTASGRAQNRRTVVAPDVNMGAIINSMRDTTMNNN
jgi:chemotaxis protein MotB